MIQIVMLHVLALTDSASALEQLGRYDDAEGFWLKAADLSEKRGDIISCVRGLGRLAVLRLRCGLDCQDVLGRMRIIWAGSSSEEVRRETGMLVAEIALESSNPVLAEEVALDVLEISRSDAGRDAVCEMHACKTLGIACNIREDIVKHCLFMLRHWSVHLTSMMIRKWVKFRG